MSKIQLVIEIDKADYEKIKKTSFVENTETMLHQSSEDRKGTMMLFRVMDAIKDGTPLPKGHGTLKDTDKLRLSLEENHDFLIDSWDGFSNMPVKEKARADEIINCIAEIVNAQTIIEADKEVDE